MADLPKPVVDLSAALEQMLFPAITQWEQVEGRSSHPRSRTGAPRRGPRRALDADAAVADGGVPRRRRGLAGVRQAASRDHAADDVPARRQPEQDFDDGVPLEAQGRAAADRLHGGSAGAGARPPAAHGAPLAEDPGQHGLDATYASDFLRGVPDRRARSRRARRRRPCARTGRPGSTRRPSRTRAMDGHLLYRRLRDHPAPRDLTLLPAPLSIASGDVGEPRTGSSTRSSTGSIG